MAALTEAFVPVRPDMDKFEPEVKRRLRKIDASKEGSAVAGRFGVGFNGAFGGIVKRSAGLFVGAFAAIKGAQVFGSFITDAAESAKISRITANAVRATGGAAKITAEQVGDLATSISNKTAIDDEQIQTAANMLLTFKNIRNETGKGNDIFNRSTQAVADLSVQFGGMEGASKQVGKALNDPLKGITALSKAGVTFTDQQKEQIKTLVESGNILGAQKIILAEIEGQVGGAAAAAADPLARLKVVAGNLGEEFGGFLLPTVERFANFAINKLVPALRQGFGYFQAEILPRLKEFSGFIVGTVVPAVAEFVGKIVTTLKPAVIDTFGFFKAEVLPRLQEFGSFLGEKVIPKVADMANWIVTTKDFLVPFVGTIIAIVGAMKAWAIIQGILNVVMAANPLGIIILLLAGLVAGLVYAYKNSDQFRKVVDTAFKVVAAAAKFMWDAVLKPIFDLLVAIFKHVWQQAQGWARIMVAAFNFLKEPAKAVFKYIIERMLDFIGAMLEGAAKAFGWVPGIGDKLKNAAASFRTFRDSVNTALNGVEDQTITVTAKLNAANIGRKNAEDRRLGNGYAYGGQVTGGIPGKDSVPGLLMPGEHVLTRADVKALGGQRAVYAFRDQLHRYADGGAVSFNVKARHSNTGKFAREVAAHAIALVRPAAQKAADEAMSLGPGGPPGSIRSFRGVRLNSRTIAMLAQAERILGHVFRITQGSYSTRVAASGSTHAGGGAMDTNGPGGWARAVRALRAAGFAAWHRTPSQGPWRDHIHSIAIGDSSASPAAKAQVRDYLRGGNGLRGMAGGGAVTKEMLRDMGVGLYDQGGPWPTGTLGYNGSGRTETVVPGNGVMTVQLSAEDRRLLRAVADRPVTFDGRRVDEGLTRRALGGGWY